MLSWKDHDSVSANRRSLSATKRAGIIVLLISFCVLLLIDILDRWLPASPQLDRCFQPGCISSRLR